MKAVPTLALTCRLLPRELVGRIQELVPGLRADILTSTCAASVGTGDTLPGVFDTSDTLPGVFGTGDTLPGVFGTGDTLPGVFAGVFSCCHCGGALEGAKTSACLIHTFIEGVGPV